MKLTDADHTENMRERKRKAGLERFEGWATPAHKVLMKRLEKALRSQQADIIENNIETALEAWNDEI